MHYLEQERDQDNSKERLNDIMETIQHYLKSIIEWRRVSEITCFRSSASDEYGDHVNSVVKLDMKWSLPFNMSSVLVDILNS